jgi:glycosyltransferase involved in cell wall biosynthesis
MQPSFNGRIRLFADAHVFDKEFQGSRTFVKEIYTQLARRENIELFLGAYDTAKLDTIFPASGNIHFIKYKSRSGVRRLLYDIPAIIAANRVHYAHFQYIIPLVKNCRFIVTIHDVIFNEYPAEFSFPYRFSKKILFTRAASKADVITTVSAYSKSSIVKHLRARPSAVHIVPNGVNNRFFQPYDKQESVNYVRTKYGIENFILCVSRFEKRKNHAGLLRAYLEARLYEKSYYLVMLGHRSLPVNELDELLKSLPDAIRKFILIRDDIDDQELPEFYKAASLFVYPSRAEGFGISPLEAGALRIPVICSNSSAMKDYQFFGENHIDTTNEKLLAKKLKLNLEHPLPAERLNRIAATVKERYNWEHSANQFYQLLSRDLANSKLNSEKQLI